MKQGRRTTTRSGPTTVEHRVVDHLFHDFKGGLATVIMGVEAVREGLWGAVGDSQSRWLMKAVQDCEAMVSLIDDFRDLMLMEEGNYPAEPETVDLSACLEALEAAINEDARQRHIEVGFQCPPALPKAEFRAQLVPRLLNRLLGVFVDCTRTGGKLLADGALVRTRGGGGKLRLDVCSEGIEAEPELLDTVFDKGRQAEVGLKVGRGYSMLFCREAAKLLGGTLRLQPWPGRGTRAEVLLPFRDAGG